MNIVLLSLLGVMLLAQSIQPTLRQLCTEAGEKGVHISAMSDRPPAPPFDDTLTMTDVIVRGTMRSSGARLTDDERDIVTIHQIENPEILFSVKPRPVTRPGISSPITFTVKGGTVMLNGCKAMVAYEGVPVLRAGSQVIFLMRDGQDQKLEPLMYGMFEVGPAGIVPLVRHEEGEHFKFQGRSQDAFLTEILARRKALRR